MIDTRTDRLLSQVHPTLSDRIRRVLTGMRAAGYPMVVTDGNRTVEQQQELYAKGRTKPGKIVTNADGIIKKSNHQDGRAVDCTFVDSFNKPYWPEDPKMWEAYGTLAELVGLVWGGRWKSITDKPHVELPPNIP